MYYIASFLPPFPPSPSIVFLPPSLPPSLLSLLPSLSPSDSGKRRRGGWRRRRNNKQKFLKAISLPLSCSTAQQC